MYSKPAVTFFVIGRHKRPGFIPLFIDHDGQWAADGPGAADQHARCRGPDAQDVREGDVIAVGAANLTVHLFNI